MTTQPNSQIGYPMAKNLRAKIPAEDTLFVHDVNTAATKQFLDDVRGQDLKARIHDL